MKIRTEDPDRLADLNPTLVKSRNRSQTVIIAGSPRRVAVEAEGEERLWSSRQRQTPRRTMKIPLAMHLAGPVAKVSSQP